MEGFFFGKILDMNVICTYNVHTGGDLMSPREKANTERVSTFLSKSHLDALKQDAEAKGINVSALIRMIILEYLAKK